MYFLLHPRVLVKHQSLSKYRQFYEVCVRLRIWDLGLCGFGTASSNGEKRLFHTSKNGPPSMYSRSSQMHARVLSLEK